MNLLEVKNLMVHFPVSHGLFSCIGDFAGLTFASTCV
jgi:hypothetical protein